MAKEPTATSTTWIPAKDIRKFPELHSNTLKGNIKKLLVVVRSRAFDEPVFGHYWPEHGGRWCVSGSPSEFKVSHFMPLPPMPPKKRRRSLSSLRKQLAATPGGKAAIAIAHQVDKLIPLPETPR